jgi:hypothetical protein
MNVELSMDEASVLREILEHHLGDMSAEISHTDNPSSAACCASAATT